MQHIEYVKLVELDHAKVPDAPSLIYNQNYMVDQCDLCLKTYDTNRKIKTVRPNQPSCVTKRNPKRNDNTQDTNDPMQTATLNAESHAILSKTVC